MGRRLTGCVLMAALATGSIAVAAHPPGGPELFQLWRYDLELTDEQLAQIQELHFETRAAEIDKRAVVEKAELKLGREMDQAEPDERRVMALFEDLHTARAELERIHLHHRLEMKSILTETQEQALRKLLREQQGEHRAPPPRAPHRF